MTSSIRRGRIMFVVVVGAALGVAYAILADESVVTTPRRREVPPEISGQVKAAEVVTPASTAPSARSERERKVLITVAGTDGSTSLSGEVLLVSPPGRNASRTRQRWTSRFEVAIPGEESPPGVAIYSPGYMPSVVVADDPRWAGAGFNVVLDPEHVAHFIVQDRQGQPIERARVKLYDDPAFVKRQLHLEAMGEPVSPRPREIETDASGVAEARIGASSRRVFADVAAFGYRSPPKEFIACEIPQGASSGTVSVVLDALLVAGVEVVTGNEALDSTSRLGVLILNRPSGSAMRGGAQTTMRRELIEFLDQRMRPGRRIYWAPFGFEPADADAPIDKFTAPYRYLPFPDRARSGERDGYSGQLVYRKVWDITDADIPVIDIAQELARRSAVVEIEFVWVESERDLPDERDWIVRSLDDPRIYYEPQRRPDFSVGRRCYSTVVGVGRYVLGPRGGFLNPVEFLPVEFEATRGQVTRVAVVKAEPSTVGRARFRVRRDDAVVVNDKCTVSLRPIKNRAQASGIPFIGEEELKLAPGLYEAQFYIGEMVASPTIEFEVPAAGQTALLEYTVER